MLSMCGNWLLVGWACVKIGYSLSEHAWKLVTRWLSIRGNILSYTESRNAFFEFLFVLSMFFSHVTRSSVPFPRSLIKVLCPLSHVSVPCLPSSVSCLPSNVPCLTWSGHCLPSSVPCLTTIFLVSHPLFSVSLLCSLSPIRRSLSHFSAPCLPSSLSCLTSLFLVSCPLSPVYVSVLCLPSFFPNLKSLFLVSHPPFSVP